MALKGLDTTFVHYGVRQSDLDIIQETAEIHALNPDAVSDILKEFHERTTEEGELDMKEIKKMISKALLKCNETRL